MVTPLNIEEGLQVFEILHGKSKTGIIVQQISNQLDAGKILAFAESKVVNFFLQKNNNQFLY